MRVWRGGHLNRNVVFRCGAGCILNLGVCVCACGAVVILDRNLVFRCGAGCIFKGGCARVCGAVTILDGNAVSCCGRRATSKAGVHVRGVFWIVRLDLVGARAAL